jgi:hypothetical protein
MSSVSQCRGPYSQSLLSSLGRETEASVSHVGGPQRNISAIKESAGSAGCRGRSSSGLPTASVSSVASVVAIIPQSKPGEFKTPGTIGASRSGDDGDWAGPDSTISPFLHGEMTLRRRRGHDCSYEMILVLRFTILPLRSVLENLHWPRNLAQWGSR